MAESLLSEGLDAAAHGEGARARTLAAALAERVGEGDARTLWVLGTIAWQEAASLRDRDGALALLRQAVAAAPDDPDIRHAFAIACEEAGDLDEMRRQFVQVRVLDARDDRRAGIADPARLELIERVASEVLESLPAAFRERMGHVAVMLEPRPSLALVREGFDPRAFGLFEGASHAEDGWEGHIAAPTRVVLFTHNLLAESESDEELGEQVEITVLHEVGHYFGLEEEDMERLGLD